jgi:hypothetical protein
MGHIAGSASFPADLLVSEPSHCAASFMGSSSAIVSRPSSASFSASLEYTHLNADARADETVNELAYSVSPRLLRHI